MLKEFHPSDVAFTVSFRSPFETILTPSILYTVYINKTRNLTSPSIVWLSYLFFFLYAASSPWCYCLYIFFVPPFSAKSIISPPRESHSWFSSSSLSDCFGSWTPPHHSASLLKRPMHNFHSSYLF